MLRAMTDDQKLSRLRTAYHRWRDACAADAEDRSIAFQAMVTAAIIAGASWEGSPVAWVREQLGIAE